jgi:hypothetical protein
MQPRSDPDHHIAEARESLVAHLTELRRRLHAMRARFDLPARIAAHPLPVVGAAFALGALLGLRGGRRQPREGEASRSLVLAALGALGVRLAKELAMRGATEAARGWWERRQSSEVRTSYEPDVEAFLRR